jgi:hypothetical protein
MTMKRLSLLVFAPSLALAQPAFAQHGGGHAGGGAHAGGGHFGGVGHFQGGPPRGPEPMRAAPTAQPRAPAAGAGFERPFVDRDAHWVGHDSGPRDLRYRVETPWPHGRFREAIGPGHRYRLGGFDPARHVFWFGSSLFLIAAADWAYADDWSWNADEIVLYPDPDHPGWYLAYNTRTGTYVHVQYNGPVP